MLQLEGEKKKKNDFPLIKLIANSARSKTREKFRVCNWFD